jgi:hypothetical protein
MMTDPSTALATVKAIAGVAKEAGKIELYAQILDLQGQISDMIEADRQKTARIHELEDQLKMQSQVEFRRNSLWTGPTDEEKDGPFCATCYGTKKVLVRLTNAGYEKSTYSCGSCKENFRVFPERYVAPQQPRVIRG